MTLARAAVQELADSLRGNLLPPGHAAYEDARLVQLKNKYDSQNLFRLNANVRPTA